MAWQQFSNRVFANGMARAIDEIKKGQADENEVLEFINFLFDDLRKPINLPGVKYARAGEIPTSRNLMITRFN